MGDCDIDGQYKAFKGDEKFTCKYSYSSWCPTCERNSPRRRSRSETSDSCRRKVRDMKTLTPKKYGRREYENMELEYDVGGRDIDARYECCRVRNELCELPTSYITNNHQFVGHNGGSFKGDSNGLRNVTAYDGTLKIVDFNEHLGGLGGMQEKGKADPLNRISQADLEYIKNWKRIEAKHAPLRNALNGLSPSKLPKNNSERLCPNQNDSKSQRSLDLVKNCREYCPLVDLKYHNLSNQKTVCYNTTTFFDRNEAISIPDCYNNEMEYLREKLKILRNNCTTYIQNHQVPHNDGTPANDKKCEEIVVSSIEIKNETKVRREKRNIFSPMVKTRNKLSLKVKPRGGSARFSANKTSRGNVPVAPIVVNESCSGTDSEDELGAEEEAESSEISTDDGNKDGLNAALNGSGDTIKWPIRQSLFPNIPPYISFNSHDSEVEYRIPNGKKLFKWKLSTITPVVVRKTLTNSGFALVRKSNQWLGTWGKHMKSPMFRTLKETQKLNHFPGTFQLGRKDRLWRNFQRMINKFGLKEFGFLPHTYVLPQELKALKHNWEFKNGGGGEMWIIKPPASARGVGIKVINKWSQLPKKTSLVVQKYISNPYLINGSKFDLRLYVLVTSFHPLRIYLYPDGLARFASAKYSDDAKDLKDRYMHLTNYSINKLSNQYTANEDANACQGHKWTLSKLMEYLEKAGLDTKSLWRNLQQLVIKTIIACEPPITQLCEENINNSYNCYELFGVDVLLDENFKPWLLEVNISPSLHSSSPLDAYIKGPLVQTLFDLAQFHLPPKLAQMRRDAPPCLNPKIYTMTLLKREREKHATFSHVTHRENYLESILKDLTGDDVRHLTRAEDEFTVKGKFERIFPNGQSYKYLSYMESRYYNKLFDAWEVKYGNCRREGIALLAELCSQNIHLKTAPQSTITKNFLSTIPSETNKGSTNQSLEVNHEGGVGNSEIYVTN